MPELSDTPWDALRPYTRPKIALSHLLRTPADTTRHQQTPFHVNMNRHMSSNSISLCLGTSVGEQMVKVHVHCGVWMRLWCSKCSTLEKLQIRRQNSIHMTWLLPINHWGITLLKFLGPLKKISGDSHSQSPCIRCQSARQVLKGETVIFATLHNCKSATHLQQMCD